MPLYEIVLRYPDRDEIRLTDRDPRLEGHVRINGWTCPIIEEGRPSDRAATRRFIVRAGSKSDS